MNLSHSSIDTYLKCGLRWEFAYDKKIIVKPPVAFHAGGGLAISSEKDLQNKIDTGELLPDEAIKDLARDAVVHRWDEEGVRLVGKEEEGKGEEKVRAETIDLVVGMANDSSHKVGADH